MGWLKRADALLLHQESDLPYIVHENGVYLCFANAYVEQTGTGTSRDQHSIEFRIHPEAAMRQSTSFYKIREFPATVPFSAVVCLDDFIQNGAIEKRDVPKNTDTADIALIRGGYLKKISSDDFDDLFDNIADYNRSFILIGDELDERVRSLSEVAEAVYHEEWFHTAVFVADQLCRGSHRRYGWLNGVPSLNISCFGFKPEHIERINAVFDDLGLDTCTSLES